MTSCQYIYVIMYLIVFYIYQILNVRAMLMACPREKKSGQVRIIFLKSQHKDLTNRNNYLTSGYRNMPQ